jgi:hypothetical protein
MVQFAVGGSNFQRKFLSTMPRSVTLAPTDRLTMFMLTGTGTSTPGYDTANLTIRVFNITGSSPTLVGSTSVDAGVTAAFGVGVGPANLAGTFTLPAKYRVFVSNVGEVGLSEFVDITVESKCTENRRSFAWLNKLGGVDQYTFTGREIGTSKTKRATVKKPYSTGTGFDFQERTYRSEPDRFRTVSTAPLRREFRRWLAEDLCETANGIVDVYGRWCPCIIVSSDARAFSTGPGMPPLTIEYKAGVDNLSQQA